MSPAPAMVFPSPANELRKPDHIRDLFIPDLFRNLDRRNIHRFARASRTVYVSVIVVVKFAGS